MGLLTLPYHREHIISRVPFSLSTFLFPRFVLRFLYTHLSIDQLIFTHRATIFIELSYYSFILKNDNFAFYLSNNYFKTLRLGLLSSSITLVRYCQWQVLRHNIGVLLFSSSPPVSTSLPLPYLRFCIPAYHSPDPRVSERGIISLTE